MLSSDEGCEIRTAMMRLSHVQLRAKVREYPQAQKRTAELRANEKAAGLREFPISEESLIGEITRRLIGRLVRNEITPEERRHFVELQVIRTELMRPESIRSCSVRENTF